MSVMFYLQESNDLPIIISYSLCTVQTVSYFTGYVQLVRPRGKVIHHVSLDVDTAKEILTPKKNVIKQIKGVALHPIALIMEVEKTELPKIYYS